jgi:hypothetical protein
LKHFIFALLLLSGLSATEESPWIDVVLEPLLSISGTYQEFAYLRCHGKNIRYPGKGYLIDTGLLFAPDKDYDIQVEIRLAQTHAHSLAIDQFKETARYVFLDDSEGDDFSLSAGITLAQVPKIALKDRSQIHHGEFEAEVQGAIGKEWSLDGYRTGRIWGLAACGIANRGETWLRGLFASEYILCFHHIFRGELALEGGFGKKSPCWPHFRGYGNVGYRFMDGKLKYGYQNEDGALFSIAVLQRVFARNAPRALKEVRAEVVYPFSL